MPCQGTSGESQPQASPCRAKVHSFERGPQHRVLRSPLHYGRHLINDTRSGALSGPSSPVSVSRPLSSFRALPYPRQLSPIFRSPTSFLRWFRRVSSKFRTHQPGCKSVRYITILATRIFRQSKGEAWTDRRISCMLAIRRMTTPVKFGHYGVICILALKLLDRRL